MVLYHNLFFIKHPYFWRSPYGWPGIVVRELGLIITNKRFSQAFRDHGISLSSFDHQKQISSAKLVGNMNGSLKYRYALLFGKIKYLIRLYKVTRKCRWLETVETTVLYFHFFNYGIKTIKVSFFSQLRCEKINILTL